MGKSGTGKTSMRSFIFSSYRSEDTQRLGSTIEVEHSHVRFPGNLVLNLWDCGGQKSYMENYMNSQRGQVFSGVAALIYVVDVVSTDEEAGDGREWETDLRYFRYVRGTNDRDCVSALQSHSPDAEVFCLLHKMDLIEPSRRRDIYRRRVADLRKKTREVMQEHASSPLARDVIHLQCFATSIWDATLYKAWSSIVHAIVPDVERFEEHLTQLGAQCSAAEVILFERATFLVMSHYSRLEAADESAKPHSPDVHMVRAQSTDDPEEALLDGLSQSMLPSSDVPSAPARMLSDDRFERVSELVKQFRLTCLCVAAADRSESQYNVKALELRTPTFLAYMDTLTSSTLILIVVTDPRIRTCLPLTQN